MPVEKRKYTWISFVCILVLAAATTALGTIAYLQTEEIEVLEKTQQTLEATLEEKRAALAVASSTIAAYKVQIFELQEDLTDAERTLQQEQRQVDRFREQLESLTDTVGQLDHLSRLDRELLRKYSRTSFLNENYRPARLTQVPDEWVLEGRQDQYFLPEAWPFLEDMLEDAARDGIELRILSAFRSFDEQRDLHGRFQQQFGSGANQFSADQGFSEHQLGTAIDIVDPETGATSQTFANTVAYEWLQDNAYRYGFILSYPEGNEFYIFEPWHWRFVGRELATDLHRAGAYFYDWDQRRIDEYLIKIFD